MKKIIKEFEPKKKEIKSQGGPSQKEHKDASELESEVQEFETESSQEFIHPRNIKEISPILSKIRELPTEPPHVSQTELTSQSKGIQSLPRSQGEDFEAGKTLGYQTAAGEKRNVYREIGLTESAGQASMGTTSASGRTTFLDRPVAGTNQIQERGQVPERQEIKDEQKKYETKKSTKRYPWEV